MRRGFTLIELMIVVAIIAVIAAIAIPNLLASKADSNETATVAALRAYVAAQCQFQRTDFYGTGSLVYANPLDGVGFPDLYEIGGPGTSGRVLKLIDATLARATVGGPPRSGYVFDDIEFDNYSVTCGLSAAPAAYGNSGRNVFVVDICGTVYKQMGTEGCVPLTQYPDVSSGWIPVGSDD